MKAIFRIPALFLTACLVFGMTGCAKKQPLLYNTAVNDSKSQITVAMNPVISYGDTEYDAFQQVSQSLSEDLSSEHFGLHEQTNWRWMYYDEQSSEWMPRENGYAARWTPLNKSSVEQEAFPYSYAFTDDATTSLTPYLKSAIRVSPYGNAAAPGQGVLLTVTGNYEEGLCFIAPKSGKVKISDPTAGKIVAVQKLAGAETSSLVNDFCDRSFQVILYLNGQPLWAAELGNPRHFESEAEEDGCYEVEFPTLSDVEVEEGDLISIVVRNLSDARTALSMIPSAASNYCEASRLVTNNGKTYIEHNGKPYLFYGVQIRPDRAISAFKPSTDEDYERYLEPYFQKTAEIGFQTIIFPIHWKQIELKKDKYSFELLKRYYDYAKKYDLTVQLLWFGSDVCGWSSNCPNYITEDTETYSRLRAYPKVLNLYDADLIEREIKAFEQLLNFLYEYDTDQRTVCIQIENEANAMAAGGSKTDSFTDQEAVDAATWVAGQKNAVYNIMNALGMMVKQGPYRCVTRTNIMWYQCYYNGVNDYQLAEVGALDGLDLVGLDSYQNNINDSAIDQTSFAGNIPHYAEFGASYYILPAQVMQSFSRGGGLLVYQLKQVDEDGTAVFGGAKDEWLYRTSERIETSAGGSIYGMDTNELSAFNKMLSGVAFQLTTAPTDRLGAFNCSDGHTLNPRQTLTVGDRTVTYTNSSGDYGGSGLAICTETGDYLLLSQHGNSTFTFENTVISGNVSVGRFDGETWIEEATVMPNGGAVTVTEELAAAGSVIRVSAGQMR